MSLGLGVGNTSPGINLGFGAIKSGRNLNALQRLRPSDVFGQSLNQADSSFLDAHGRKLRWAGAGASRHFHSSSAPRLRRFSTKRGWARLMISALRTTERPGIAAATIVSATAARMM